MEISILLVIFTAMAYGAGAIFIVGFLSKVSRYYSTPSPLRIPTTPAPLTTGGVIIRVLGDVIFFNSLFKSNKWTWLGGVLFHWSFLFVVLRHLRYFFYPVPGIIMALQPIGVYAGWLLPVAIIFLLARRLMVDRTVFISSMPDYFVLALVFGIAVTGLMMKYYVRPFMVDVKGFVFGLVSLNPSAPPADIVFLLHFSLVMLLLVFFPYSKLIHAGGIFFSPTRTQTDTPREQRHVNPWSPNLNA